MTYTKTGWIVGICMAAVVWAAGCSSGGTEESVGDDVRCYEACRHIDSLCTWTGDDLTQCQSRCIIVMEPLSKEEKYDFMSCITRTLDCDLANACFDSVPDGDDEAATEQEETTEISEDAENPEHTETTEDSEGAA